MVKSFTGLVDRPRKSHVILSRENGASVIQGDNQGKYWLYIIDNGYPFWLSILVIHFGYPLWLSIMVIHPFKLPICISMHIIKLCFPLSFVVIHSGYPMIWSVGVSLLFNFKVIHYGYPLLISIMIIHF